MRPYDERLDHFLSRAAKVFADQGYHSTTMRDLAAATDMSLAGMYYYVRGKEELLFRIQERCFMRVLAGAEGALAGPAEADPGARLQAFIRHHVTFISAMWAAKKVTWWRMNACNRAPGSASPSPASAPSAPASTRMKQRSWIRKSSSSLPRT